MVYQDTLQLAEHGQGAYDITDLVNDFITESSISTGTCQLFIHSSNASLLVVDVVDENTKKDTADFLAQLAPSGGAVDARIDRGMEAIPLDMREVVTRPSLALPVSNARAGIGVWQGIYLWERSLSPVERKLTITVMGE
jgi:secondary thiamine-phosphate synthase enzyme